MTFIPYLTQKSKKQSNAYVEVETSRVIDCCNRVLFSIKKRRERLRQEYLNEYIESSKWWHTYFGWLGFAVATEQDAAAAFDSEVLNEIKYYYVIQESECELLLKAAQVSNNSTMAVSSDGLKYCNYKSYKS